MMIWKVCLLTAISFALPTISSADEQKKTRKTTSKQVTIKGAITIIGPDGKVETKNFDNNTPLPEELKKLLGKDGIIELKQPNNLPIRLKGVFPQELRNPNGVEIRMKGVPTVSGRVIIVGPDGKVQEKGLGQTDTLLKTVEKLTQGQGGLDDEARKELHKALQAITEANKRVRIRTSVARPEKTDSEKLDAILERLEQLEKDVKELKQR